MPLFTDTAKRSDRLTPRVRPLLRSVLRLAAFSFAGLILLVLLILFLLQLPFVAGPVARLALSLANPWDGTEATVSSAAGTWLTDLALREVRIASPDGSLVIAIDSLGATYDLAALFDGELRFKSVRLIRPVVVTGTTPDGDLEFLHPFRSEPDLVPDTSQGLKVSAGAVYVSGGGFLLHSGGNPQGPTADVSEVLLAGRHVAIGREISVEVDTLSAAYRERPDALERMRVYLSGGMNGDLITVRSLQLRSPRTDIRGSGTVALPFDTLFTTHPTSFQLSANPIAYGDLHPLVDAFGPEGSATVHVSLARDSLHASIRVSGAFEGGGSFEVTGRANAREASPPALRLDVRTARASISGFTGPTDTTQSIDVLATLEGTGSAPAGFTGILKTEVEARGLVGPRDLRASLDASLRDGVAELRASGSLDALTFTLGGRISAFSDPPAYDLTVSPRVLRSQSDLPPDDVLGMLSGLRGTLTMSGTGFDPYAGKGRAHASLTWDENPHIRSLLVDAFSADSTIEAKALLITPEGSLRADARARGGINREFELRMLEFTGIDLSAFLGTQGAMALTGSAFGEVRGNELQEATGTLSLRLDSSVVGTTRISSAHVDARLETGRVTATVDAKSSDGDLHLEGSGTPFADRFTATIQEAAFRGLDLGGLLLDDDGATDLNGSARGQVVLNPSGGAPAAPGGTAVRPASRPAGSLRVDLERSRIYRQVVLSTALGGELIGDVATMELDVRTPAGGLSLSGSLTPFDDFLDARIAGGRFEHLDVGALAGIDSLETDISGTLAGELQGTSWGNASGFVALDILPSRINREPVSQASLVADVAQGEVSVRGYGDLAAGSVNIKGSGSIADDRVSFDANATAAIHDLSRLLRDSAFAASTASLSLTAGGVWGPPDITHVDARLLAGGNLDSLRVDSLFTVLSVEGRVIEVESLLVSSNVGTLHGSGTIAVFDTIGAAESDFTLEASVHSPGRLQGMTGIEFSRNGTARTTASLAGTGRAGRLDFSVEVANLGVEDILVPGLKAGGHALLTAGPAIGKIEAGAAVSELAIGELVFDTVRVSASAGQTGAAFEAALALDTGENLAFGGTGTRLEDRYRVTLDSLALDVGDRLWLLEHPAHIEAGEALIVDDFSLLSGERKIRASGTLSPVGEQDFRLQIDSLSFDRAARLLGRPNLGGEVSLSASVTGPARHPKATGRLDAHISSDGQQVGTIGSDLDWTGGLLKIATTVAQPDQSGLNAVITLPASLPFVSTTPAAGAGADSSLHRRREFLLRTDGFDLRFLKPFFGSQTIQDPRGLLTADITLHGSGKGFSGSGRLGIDTAFARVNSIGVEYSDITLRASLDGSNFRIDSISARTGQGSLSASGTVSLASLQEIGFDLTIDQSKFLGVNQQHLRIVTDGQVEVRGTLKQPVVTGDVTVAEANFVVPETAGSEQVESVQLTDEDYAILRERFGYRRPPPGSAGAADTTRLSLDVALHFPRRSWIRKKANPSLSIEIEGDLRVRSMPGEPLSLVGILKPVPGRSYVSQFGRQFEIKSGEIRFDGPPEGFVMNIDSEYKVPARSGSGLSEATIRMQVERKLERFQFNLSSDPPMEQADILSYLTTGTATTGAFASTSSQGNIATSAALEQVVGAIGGLAEDKIPLDIFQIRQDGARGITIVAGNYVSPKTYLGVRYPILLQQTGQDNYYDTGTEFEVEYQSFPWLFLNAKGGSSRLMLLLKSRYAY